MEEAMAIGRTLRLYDYHGRPILSHAEWERLGRWRRFWDWVRGTIPIPDELTGYDPRPLDPLD